MLMYLSAVNMTTAMRELAMMVVKIAWANLQLMCLWTWLAVAVDSELCLVGVAKLLVRARIMSEKARLATKRRDSLLVEV